MKKYFLPIFSALVVAFPAAFAAQSKWEQDMKEGQEAFHQGELGKAENAFLSAITEAKKSGKNDLRAAKSLSSLAAAYNNDEKLADAENTFKQALSIREQILKPGHPDLWKNLIDLSEVYELEGKFSDAEASLKHALAIRQQAVGPNHPDIADNLCDLAAFYEDDFSKKKQSDYNQAEILYKRALTIREKRCGANSLLVANTLDEMTDLYDKWVKYAEAEQLCRRAFSIHENMHKFKGIENKFDYLHKFDYIQNKLDYLHKLADLCDKQGKYNEAEKFYKQAIVIAEKTWGKDNAGIDPYLNYFSDFLRTRKRDSEAEKVESRMILLESHSGAGP